MAVPVQIRFRPVPDSGYIEIWIDNVKTPVVQTHAGGVDMMAAVLSYPRQGSFVGQSRNEDFARQLNEAAATLNDKLKELCS